MSVLPTLSTLSTLPTDHASGAASRLCAAAVVSAALMTLLGACAAPSSSAFRDTTLTVQSASDRVVPGQSTRLEVSAALGPATVIRFDSGFEVWAYRAQSAGSGQVDTELVVLFSPSGVVQKKRLRLPGG